MKDNTFKFSSRGLKQAQEKIKNKSIFKPNSKNFEKYQIFILDAYKCNSEYIKRKDIL